jgi:mediator of RNA polymerase II transcription subunit 31
MDNNGLDNFQNSNYQQLSEETQRFILDLEFVQCLANPSYLQFLAQHENRYFKDPKFIAYLKYLLYWKRPEYAKFIIYPHCLYFLDLLQEEDFRLQLINDPNFVSLIRQQQLRDWKYGRNPKLPAETSLVPQK